MTRLPDGTELISLIVQWGYRREEWHRVISPGDRSKYVVEVERGDVFIRIEGTEKSIITLQDVRFEGRPVRLSEVENEDDEVEPFMWGLKTRRAGKLSFELAWPVIPGPGEAQQRFRKGQLVHHELHGVGRVKSKGPVVNTFLVEFRGEPAARLVGRRSISHHKMLRTLKKY